MSRVAAAVTALLLLVLAVAAPASARSRRAPYLAHVQCVRGCLGHHRIAPGAMLRLRGYRFSKGLRAAFRTRPHGRRHTAPVRVAWRRRGTVLLPDRATTGVLFVKDAHGRRSNHIHRPFRVKRPTQTPAVPAGGTPSATAFDGNGMWIWYVSKASGGDLSVIANQALSHGVSTVFIKSSDGTTPWGQFSPSLVATLKAYGLHVCAWQYVYGTHAATEADLGAQAVADGADCLAIDAETEYEGRYAAAQQYLGALRAAVGPDFPVGFTSFPYVDYHPRLPYSVFLGPGGAQANLPQVYWRSIGGTVDAVSGHTVAHNRLYGVPIAPLGQTYGGASPDEISRFRALWAGYGSAGLSWWSWQASPQTSWDALALPSFPVTVPDPGWPALERGKKGDEVVWLQQHLGVPVTATFDPATDLALRTLQAAHGLEVTGVTDPLTWQQVLALPLQPHPW
jgi:peptidoglycan hydrolase-like protein with peptidoglycan-binding domain